MDTAATTRPEFRDHHNQDNYQHSYPSSSHTQQQQQQQQQQHYSHTTPFTQPPPPPPPATSSTLQPFLPSSHLPHPFRNHDALPRHTSSTLPPHTSSLTRPAFSASPRQPARAPPQPHSLYQPQFKPLPSADASFPDARAKHAPPPSRRPASQPFPASAPFPPPAAPADKKHAPFPFPKSLPFPIAQPPQSKPAAAAHPASAAPADRVRNAPPKSPPRVAPPQQQEQGPLYDISKLLSAHCTIVSGKVYNDKGHNICGVLNQHDKPCKRIGKCPFHGEHKPVTADNSVNGSIDASGTVPTPSTSPDGSNSPTHPFNSPGGSDNTTVNGKPKIPPKQQYKHGWSKEEHFLFLGGLSQHGKGSWKQIASVVKTRTPTQVQSHAQKYFQRQKQTDKNKRSIHDLSLDSPEMLDVAKKLKTSGARIALPGSALGEPMAIANVADVGALRTHSVAITPPALTLNHSTLPRDNVGRAMLNDSGMGRFGGNVQSPLDSKFGHVQATSNTTLGSLNSGVQIPNIPGTSHNRSFPTAQTNVGQPELFGQLNHGTIQTASDRRHTDNRLPMKMDGTPGRDVILNSVRPAFMQDPYQGSTNTPLLPGQHFLGGKQSLYGNQSRTAGLSGHETTTSADHNTTQAAYNANALQGLYGHMGGNANVFPQGRSGTDTQLPWGYDSEGKARRQRDVQTTNRDFHLQNTHLGTTLQGIGQIPLPDHLGGAPGITNEHTVDQPFDGSHQNQGNAFASGIFGGNEGVEVDTNVYGVGGGQANTVQVPGRLGTGVSGYPQSTGMQMGQMPLQTAFGAGAGAYHRND